MSLPPDPGARRLRGPVPSAVVAFVGLAAIAVLGSAVPANWTWDPRLPQAGQPTAVDLSPLLQPQPEPPSMLWPQTTTTASTVFGVVAYVLLGLVLVALAVLIWRRIPKRRVRIVRDAPADPVAGEVTPDLARLRAGVLDAWDELAQEGEPRDAVVRSWLALERAAEAAGWPRDPSASPTEFTTAVLLSTDVDDQAVRTLLGLYQRARFSGHEIGLAEVRAARQSVLALSRTWRGFDDALRASVTTSRG